MSQIMIDKPYLSARSIKRTSLRFIITSAMLISAPVSAGPWIAPGDSGLRHDIQLLADYGLISVPLTTWPLPWADIAAELQNHSSPSSSAAPIPSSLEATRQRVLKRLRAETDRGGVIELGVRASERPLDIRGFENTPRESSEVEVAADWIGERFAYRLNMTYVDDPDDNKSYRWDGSYLGMSLGNWMVSFGSQARWWGPGWDGSLILSNNARPVTGIGIQRSRSTAFQSPLLSWLGPWNLTLFAGQLESSRHVSDAKLLGARVVFKPYSKLEIGLSRTAQWGGEGRPENARSLWDLAIGRDNRGGDITEENEPGNQLGGYDFRWRSPIGDWPYALYGQFIGEDEAGGAPSRRFGQVGFELWFNRLVSRSSVRLIIEYTDTAAKRIEGATPLYDYVYNHAIYKDGYRYHGRSLGHGYDNDSRGLSAAAVMNFDRHGLYFLLRRAKLNSNDKGLHSLALSNETRNLVYLQYSYRFSPVVVQFGLGYEKIEPGVGQSDNNIVAGLALNYQI